MSEIKTLVDDLLFELLKSTRRATTRKTATGKVVPVRATTTKVVKRATATKPVATKKKTATAKPVASKASTPKKSSLPTSFTPPTKQEHIAYVEKQVIPSAMKNIAKYAATGGKETMLRRENRQRAERALAFGKEALANHKNPRSPVSSANFYSYANFVDDKEATHERNRKEALKAMGVREYTNGKVYGGPEYNGQVNSGFQPVIAALDLPNVGRVFFTGTETGVHGQVSSVRQDAKHSGRLSMKYGSGDHEVKVHTSQETAEKAHEANCQKVIAFNNAHKDDAENKTTEAEAGLVSPEMRRLFR